MAKNLPLHVDMTLHGKIAARARLAFQGELQTLAYGSPDVDLAILDHELRLAFYRVAHQGSGVVPPPPPILEDDAPPEPDEAWRGARGTPTGTPVVP